MKLIADQALFDDWISRCRDEGLVAFDTEFIRERRYRPRLCLLQIGLANDAIAVDPFEIGDLSGLVELLADPDVCKIVHAGQQDMEIFFADDEGSPANVFDTQIAAALLGHGDACGYSRLVLALLDVRVSKTQTFTDWARRPLADQQILYALDDVIHLHPMRELLVESLEESGRMPWVEEELRIYQDPTFYRRDPSTLYRRVKGAAKLSRKDLAVLQSLTIWRESEASERDRPRNHIISDDILVELVKAGPTKVDDLRSFRGVHPQLARRSGVEIVERVSKALDLAKDEWPAALDKPARDSSMAIVVDLLETFLKARTGELRISPGYLATRSELHELVRQKRAGALDDSALRVLSGWRRDMIGEDLVGLLDGRYSLAIEPESGGVVVQPRNE
jgi:ribonuclease D